MRRAFIHIYSMFVLLLATECLGHEPFTMVREPDPFRRDDGQLNGRDFEYTTTGFLNRFSYRFRPSWNDAWLDDPEGYRITAGSVRSRDLYVVHFLRKTIEFNETFSGHIRHRRDEDFDSRYDRTLVGMSANIGGGWSVAALSDIIATKEDIDLQFELSWEGEAGNRFRIAFVSVDHFFNDKQDGAHYRQKPYTIFAEAHRKTSGTTRIGGSVNWNPQLQLVFDDEGREYRYQQFMAESYLSWRMDKDLGFLFSVKAESGERSNRFETSLDRINTHFNRDNIYLDAQTHYRLRPDLTSWFGVRYFFLDEVNDLADGTRDFRVKRSEPMLHAGIEWNITEKWTFWPGIFVTSIDDFDQTIERDEERERSIHGRLTLPVEYAFSDFAYATFNPTFRAPSGPFGGFNVQFQVLF
jgi:hypothetical protein